MKKHFFLIFFFTIPILTFSQHFGFKVGVNRSIFSVSDNQDESKFEKNYAFQIGAIYERPLSKTLFINSGALFSTKGSAIEPRTASSQNYKVRYFQVPINLMFKYEFEDVLLFVSTGPYFAYAISGKIKGVSSSSTEYTKSIDFGNAEDCFNHFDYGFNFSIGVQLNNCQVSIGQDFGIADIRNLNYTVTRNRSLQFTVCLFY